MKNRNTKFTTILLALACFGLLPKAQAVSPAPDGGYANANTAEGTLALFNLTSGLENTANGFEALYHNTTGQYNTAIGGAALFYNTTASNNTATGTFALNQNTGNDNTATGLEALFKNTIGIYNTASGSQALYFNTTGGRNTANGAAALYHNTANNSTANGAVALYHNTTGIRNTATGDSALYYNTTGYNNIALGVAAGAGVTTAHDVICIGANGANVSNSCYIGQIFNATSSGGVAVFVNSNGRLGTATSSRRFKEEIKPMDKASEAILALKPVTFRYKKDLDPDGIPQFGLVAEEVEKVNPNLVARDKEGKAYTVRYEAVNAMLLNEFLKEHRTVRQQQKEIDTLRNELKEQRVLIQKVSAQVEMSNPAPQVVVSHR